MRPRKKRSRKLANQDGSALLISLMVMVGLSMLGLGFVAISETESLIAINERNALETQAAAESGARLIMEWFQDPDWALARNIMPVNDPVANANLDEVKTTRHVGSYSGDYKPAASSKLCDKPYKPGYADRFYGTENAADLIVNSDTDATILGNINTALFGSATANPRLTDVRIYAPPISGGTLDADPADATKQFWAGGTRYGVATIAATASKFDNQGNAISTKIVRIVVGEFPTPVPAGPVQSAEGNITYGGSLEIHWGMKLSGADLADSGTEYSVIPWANPYEHAHYERGYDAENWPVVSGSTYDESDYLAELVDKTYTDPWFGTRAFGNNARATCCTTYEWYMEEGGATDDGYSAFEDQNANNYPTKKRVTFPIINYDFWKRVALQGRGVDGIYYFKYAGASSPASEGGLWQRNGVGASNTIAWWANSNGASGLNGGLYFFDTPDGSNPQTAGTPTLSPDISWQAGDLANTFVMKGFIYLNSGEWRITGVGGQVEAPYLMPGEPFRDIGYRKWDDATDAWAPDPELGGPAWYVGAADGIHSYQDLNENGRFDVVVFQREISYVDSGDPGDTPDTKDVWVPKTWHSNSYTHPTLGALPDCEVPPDDWDGDPVGNLCSEPHEPYLNFLYPAARTGSITVGWEANDAQSQRKKETSAGTCADHGGETTPANIPDKCTSNAHDEDGPLVGIPAIVDGLLYIEGDFAAQGQAHVYGAVLAGTAVDGTGNMSFWFKEALTRGDHVPPGAPRVIPYSIQTDDPDDD